MWWPLDCSLLIPCGVGLHHGICLDGSPACSYNAQCEAYWRVVATDSGTWRHELGTSSTACVDHQT